VLTQLFLRLEEEEGEAKQQFRFMLALLLMRKRLLKMQDSVREEGREYWRLMLMSDRSIHKVWNPELAPEQVDRLSAQLTAILSGGADAIEVLEGNAEPEAPEEGDDATVEGDGTGPTEVGDQSELADPGEAASPVTADEDAGPVGEVDEAKREADATGGGGVVETADPEGWASEREDEAS
jgi:hypothetical protein